jgi:hypothetical protein
MNEIIKRVLKIEHGFKGIEVEAQKIFDSNPITDCKEIATGLLENEHYQVRCIAVFLFGYLVDP